MDCVIMDGIMMGSRQDLAPLYYSPSPPSTVIPECEMKDRVFLLNVAARKKLSAYAGLHRGRYSDCEQLSSKDFKDLCQSLKERPALEKIVQEAGKTCPKSHQKLLGELSRGSPTCGIVQLTSKEELKKTLDILLEVVNESHSHTLLLQTCPKLHDILVARDVNKNFGQSLERSFDINGCHFPPTDARRLGIWCPFFG